MTLDFKVLTLNCWGIPVVSSDRTARMMAIGEKLASGKYDIVCLQEVWSQNDFTLLTKLSKAVLPHSHYFRSGVLGSGVCVLTKYPIKEAFFHQWSVNGYVHKVQHGDWFGGKGVGLCRLQCADFIVNVYTAHLHAEYNRLSDEYRAHRVLQSFDTAQFIRLTAGSANAIILAGDLNTEPEDLEYRILLSSVYLKDSFLINNEEGSDISGTNECAKNSYTPSKFAKKRPAGKRIDYILFKSGRDAKMELINYSLPFPDRVENKKYSYSDHEAVLANFQIKNSIVRKTSIDSGDNLLLALKEGIDVCNQSLTHLKRQKIFFVVFTVLFAILLLGTARFEPPLSYKEIIMVIKILLSCYMFFMCIMATLWNSIENNATIAGINSMEILLNQALQVSEATIDY